MRSGAYEGVTSHAAVRYRLEWTSEVTANNASLVSVTVMYRADTPLQGSARHVLSLGDVQKTRSVSLSLSSTAWEKADALDFITVPHAEDGSGSATVTATVTLSGVTFTLSHKIELEVIDRSSVIEDVSGGTAGELLSVSFTPCSAAFSFDVTVCVGDWRYVYPAVCPGSTERYTLGFYLPSDVAIAVTEGKTAEGIITLETRLADKQLGTGHDRAFTVTIPDTAAYRPSITLKTAPVTALTGALASLYVQGKTRVSVTPDTSCRYGAGVAALAVTVGGTPIEAAYEAELPTAGEVTVTATVTDTRGMSATATTTLTVLAYEPPRLLPPTGQNTPVISRANAAGEPAASGTALYVGVRPAISALVNEGTAHNTCVLEMRIRKSSSEAFGAWRTLGENAPFSGVVGSVSLLATASYAVQLRVTDSVGESVTLTRTVSTEEVTLHLRAGGMGAAFGKYAEEERVLELAPDWTLRVLGTLEDGVTLTDVAALSDTDEESYCRVRVSGGRRVWVDLHTPLEWNGTPVTLCEALVPASLCPAHTQYALGVGEGGIPVCFSLNTAGDLAVTHVYPLTGEKTLPFTLSFVDGHITFEKGM